MATKRLRYPAPRRNWKQSEFGLWFSESWTEQAVLEALEGGAWFSNTTAHEFKDVAAKRAAGLA